MPSVYPIGISSSEQSPLYTSFISSENLHYLVNALCDKVNSQIDPAHKIYPEHQSLDDLLRMLIIIYHNTTQSRPKPMPHEWSMQSFRFKPAVIYTVELLNAEVMKIVVPEMLKEISAQRHYTDQLSGDYRVNHDIFKLNPPDPRQIVVRQKPDKVFKSRNYRPVQALKPDYL
jgi:hypothetical protein